MFKQTWHGELSESPRACFYRVLKPTHAFSKYLDSVTVKSHRQALSRLIVSSHKLHMETGRWKNPITSHNERYCPHCPRVLEDEYHLLLECSMYLDIRKRLIPKYYWERPSMFKALELLNSENNSLLKRLGKYVYLALQLKNANF